MRRLRFPHPVWIAGAATVALVLSAGSVPAQDRPDSSVGPATRSTAAVHGVVVDEATGNPRLVRFAGVRPTPGGDSATAKARNFVTSHAAVFGLTDPSRELETVRTIRDPLGGEQVVFRQVYHGVPVFGAVLRVHLDGDGAVSTINGTVIPDLDIDPVPTLDSLVVEAAAVRHMEKERGLSARDLYVAPAELTVYREGLVRGRPGRNHLAWEIEISRPPNLDEVLYFDAHDGRLLDQRSNVHDLNRVIHLQSIPRPIWSEGDALPFDSGDPAADAEINELIAATSDTYTLFANLTNGQYLSYDGLDATMNSVYDADDIDCPNAVESGGVTGFCVGSVSDDVAAHEWTHAYTDWTHGLIYQWQPGALNEATSDIFGELVDQLNGRGSDTPGGIRPPIDCSNAGGSPSPTLEITPPSNAAGDYPVGGAVFNPVSPWTVTATVEMVSDGIGTTSDACEPILDFGPGSIALVDRGSCYFRDKVLNAQNVGAVGVIIVNNQGNDVIPMGGDLPRLDIPAVFLGQSDGDRIKLALSAGVTATLSLSGELTDSLRWIVGEDAETLGAIRDMWSPGCFGDPGRVGSVDYACSAVDNGGVHTNSGVPNHAFALLVDGGSFNGHQIRALGAVKAARIYWRAMAVYQTPVSDFADHADLLEASCVDLVGAQLYDLQTGVPVADAITVDDCAEVSAAMDAVEMRAAPVQCSFQTLLDPDPPAVAGNLVVFDERFDNDPGDRWELSNHGIFPEYEPRDWVWTDEAPAGGQGGAFFAVDSVLIGDCRPGSDDQSGVMELTSPEVLIPAGTLSPTLVFDHWVATEPGWDGGNIKISVNGSAFMQVSPNDFLFNSYTGRIESGNTNPLAGQRAFTGTDAGSLSGSWGQSQIDLGSMVSAGDRIVVRFDFGVDGCNGAEGWYVDNVQVIATASAPRHVGGRVQP